MFDKITIRASVSSEQCAHLASLHCLHVWTNEKNTAVEYRSSEYSKISGIDIKIRKNIVMLRCSLHKFWNLRNYGRLRNDNLFTISEARSALEMLLYENGLLPGKARIVQFEIGLNLEVSYDPITFIEKVIYIATCNRTSKIMFVDANYKINRQKTSEKNRDIRRYYKIYDKGWEMAEKRRKPAEEEENPVHILRIETVYRRHNERLDKFFTDDNIKRLVQRFWMEWKDLNFDKKIRAHKGTKKSEKERAHFIVNYGAEEYLERIKKEYAQKELTAKEYRTIREFIRDFNKNEDKYKVIISDQEKEYKMLIPKVFKHSKT